MIALSPTQIAELIIFDDYYSCPRQFGKTFFSNMQKELKVLEYNPKAEQIKQNRENDRMHWKIDKRKQK